MTAHEQYRGYHLAAGDQEVEVFDPRFKDKPAVFRALSVDAAKTWVDDFRIGRQWAVDAAIRLTEGAQSEAAEGGAQGMLP